MQVDGALLINKARGLTSFGVIENLQRLLTEAQGLKKRDQPKLGHGGTLDPFATGLLTVCSGRAVKLARYFLGSDKTYEGIMRFGETTMPGDPTAEISEKTDVFPESLEQIQNLAAQLTKQGYLQTPPMYSAKKYHGSKLYELARVGVEIDREPKLCQLYSFEILSYEKPRAAFRVRCSSGTYIRTLAQDLAKMLGSLALLESLERTRSGAFRLEEAFSLEQIAGETRRGVHWNELSCFIPFDRLLDHYDRAEATPDEARSLICGQQHVLFPILKRTAPSPFGVTVVDSPVAIYCGTNLIAVAKKDQELWGIERVFGSF